LLDSYKGCTRTKNCLSLRQVSVLVFFNFVQLAYWDGGTDVLGCRWNKCLLGLSSVKLFTPRWTGN
jgi:hypothetical protein